MRKTVSEDIIFEGYGLHTGEMCRIRLAGSLSAGLVFQKNGVEIPALLKYKSGDNRGTSLSAHGEAVHTVEHLLSALYGLGITDCLISFEAGSEVPIFDGSALPFAEALQNRTKNTEGDIEYLSIPPETVYSADDVAIKYSAAEDDTLSVSFTYDGSGFGMGIQRFESVVDPASYLMSVAPARTFGFWEEIEALKKAGLIRGGSLENALVIKDGLPVNGAYRMDNELAAHKTLDFIGDMALCGKRLRGRFDVARSGHRHNTGFLKQIMEA